MKEMGLSEPEWTSPGWPSRLRSRRPGPGLVGTPKQDVGRRAEDPAARLVAESQRRRRTGESSGGREDGAIARHAGPHGVELDRRLQFGAACGVESAPERPPTSLSRP